MQSGPQLKCAIFWFSPDAKTFRFPAAKPYERELIRVLKVNPSTAMEDDHPEDGLQ